MAILGVVIMGFGFISAVDADKPPFSPPDYYFVPGYPDASNVNGRIFPGYTYDPDAGPWNIFEQSDVSFIFQGWVYWEVELDMFPQPIRVHVWVRPAGSGDDAWVEVKLSRNSIGHGNLEDWVPPDWLEFVAGPEYHWYAYFEPGYWDVGEYETHLQYTCKDPNNPKNKEMVVWDTVTGELLDYYGMFLVQEG